MTNDTAQPLPLEAWEAEADQFYKDTGYMRPGKDDPRNLHTYLERHNMFVLWWRIRAKPLQEVNRLEQENQAIRAALETCIKHLERTDLHGLWEDEIRAFRAILTPPTTSGTASEASEAGQEGKS